MIGEALTSLVPNAKWRLEGNDYSNIEWFSGDIEKPTLESINAEITRLQAEIVAKQQAAEAAKQSALTKLAALGLTDAEIKALTGN